MEQIRWTNRQSTSIPASVSCCGTWSIIDRNRTVEHKSGVVAAGGTSSGFGAMVSIGVAGIDMDEGGQIEGRRFPGRRLMVSGVAPGSEFLDDLAP